MLALVVLVSGLAYLRLLSGPLLAVRGFDKLAHLVLFGALAFFFDLWLRGRDLRLGRLRLPFAPLLLFAAAATEEALQSLSPARSAELLDLICDLVGMLLALLLSRKLLRASRP